MDLFKNLKNLVVEDVEVPDIKNVTPTTNQPSYTPTPIILQSVDQEAIKILDEKSKAKFAAAINAKNPKFYNKLNDLLTTLAEDNPNEAQTYKTALKLLAKDGATPQLLLSDLDLCLSAIEENNKDFTQSADKKLSERTSSHQANIISFEQAISQKQQQIQALQIDIVNLTNQKTNETNLIGEESQKINLGKERFIVVYNQLRTQLQKQKDNISNFAK